MKIFEALLLNESIVDDLRNSLVKGFKPDYGPESPTYNNITKEFDRMVSWAKRWLRKGEDENSAVDNSKLVWLMTWWVLDTKLGLIQQAQKLSSVSPSVYPVDSPERASLEQYNNVFTDKEIQKVKNKAKQLGVGGRLTDFPDAYRGIFPDDSASSFAQALVHFLGTHGISNKVRAMPLKSDMPPLEAMGEWKEIEDEWLQNLADEKRSIEHGGPVSGPEGEGTWNETFDVLIKFPDGSAWFNLNRAECKDEGDSMGHCGNTAGQKETDTIYSYRTPHQHKENHWVPHLTFIYNQETGMLGEMKGYGNKKPTKKYHDVIRALITSEYVDGIAGGGYLPEENFSVWDLPDAQELVKVTPALGGDNLLKYVQEIGVDENLEKFIRTFMEEGTYFKLIDANYEALKKDFRLDLIEAQITVEYPNLEKLIEAEFHDSPYWQLLKGTGDWDIQELAIHLTEEEGCCIPHEEILDFQLPPVTRHIIIEELAKVSGEEPATVEDNLWDFLQNHGGDFSDGIMQALQDGILDGWVAGIKSTILYNAVEYIEGSYNGYFGHGAKEVELAINAKRPSRWDLEDNPMFISAKLIEILDVLTAINRDEGGEGHGWQYHWWNDYAVEHDEGDAFTQEEIAENTQWSTIDAVKGFSSALEGINPRLQSGEDFVSMHKRMKDDFSESVNEDCGPEGKKKVKRLAHTLTNIAPDSKVMHKKLHMLCAKLGLSHEQCHALTHKEGYT
ncbi:MAG: hypothetical protein CXT73_02240 [Methanobacteriota archaeon]|nr:MAG: hypothetical protein CXT73_02240 [Euryarchaeota archaeon]